VRSIPKGCAFTATPNAPQPQWRRLRRRRVLRRARERGPTHRSASRQHNGCSATSSTTQRRLLRCSHHHSSIVVCVPCVELHDDARHVEGARTCFQPSLDSLMSFCGIFSLSCSAMASAPMHAQSTCTGQFTECACVRNICFQQKCPHRPCGTSHE